MNEQLQRAMNVSTGERIATLEKLVCLLAQGILLHEYAKDLCRNGIEDALQKLAYENDLRGALAKLKL